MSKNSIFPPQKLPLSKKGKEWKETSLEAIISRYFVNDVRKHNIKIAYDIMNSEFDLDDLKYVTDPFKVGEGFPAKIQNINIIRPKIELLKGEETKRPDSFVVYRTDEDAVESVIEKQKEMIYGAIEESLVNSNIENDEQQMQFLQARLKEIKSYISNEYYDPAEQTALKTLRYLKEKLDLKDEFLKGFEDALIAGEEIYYNGIVNGEPVLERVNPLNCAYDRDPNLKFIDQGEWFVRHEWMTPSAVYDRFYDVMDEGDLDDMLDAIQNGGRSGRYTNTGSKLNTSYIQFKSLTGNASDNYYNLAGTDDRRKGAFISVFHGTWKSYKKIGYLSYVNPETGEEIEDIVDETYKPVEGESIVWDWITEWWEGYRIGENIYVAIQPIEYQDVSIDNPNSQNGCYTGGVYNYNNSVKKSLVEIMKPLQYIYLILWYRLELALARDKGKILTMDITQIPKGLGIDEYKWMHYLTSMGVNFINPYDEGWNIPGREGGKPSSMNQFGTVDLTMSNVIAEYVQLMEKVESMIGELSGVSKQRQGAIEQRELVGNVQRSVIQSSHITEPLFWRHNQIKRRALTNLLNIAKFAYKMHDKKKINFILKGTERTFIDINENFLYSDYDVFLTDSTKEYQDIQQLQTLYQPAMQNGATLLDIASIMSEDNMSTIKQKLSDIEKRRAEMMQQSQEAEQAMIQQETQLKQEELRIKEEDSIRKAETAINVALIGAESKDGDNDYDMEEPEDNSLEIEKLNITKDKNAKDYEIKRKQLDETIRSNQAKESIARSKPKTINTKK